MTAALQAGGRANAEGISLVVPQVAELLVDPPFDHWLIGSANNNWTWMKRRLQWMRFWKWRGRLR